MDFFVCPGKRLEVVATLRREAFDNGRRKKPRQGATGLVQRFLKKEDNFEGNCEQTANKINLRYV